MCSRASGEGVEKSSGNVRAMPHGEAVGGVTSREYNTWKAMRARCANPANAKWPRYGGRGIKVCERWESSVANFIADVGRCPPGYTLDRINNDLGYSPENCRWTDPKTQSRNTRRNVWYEYRGAMRCISEIAEMVGVPPRRLHYRLVTLKMPMDQAIEGAVILKRRRPRK